MVNDLINPAYVLNLPLKNKKQKTKPEQQGLDSWLRAHGDAGKRHREIREACAPPAYLPHTDLLSGASELYLFIINW